MNMCGITKLTLGYSECKNQDIQVIVQEYNKKNEPIEVCICRECWVKLSKNDKFYHNL